jgi:hypothetical protein
MQHWPVGLLRYVAASTAAASKVVAAVGGLEGAPFST